MLNVIIVGIGGFLGASARYGLGLYIEKTGAYYPLKTLAVNLVGCFIMGLVTALACKYNNFSKEALLFIKVGICGGFTTFSAFSQEAFDLIIKEDNFFLGFIYVVSSILLSLILIFIPYYFIK